jgi:hypothetical protein
MRAATIIAILALSLGPAIPAHSSTPDGPIQYLPAIAGDYFAIDGDSLFPLLATQQLFLGYDENLPD